MGLFQKTVPLIESDPLLSKIAVFRIDGNFYDSYADALYYGYEKVPVGGIVIFDDVFSHAAVMRAWLDFKGDQGLSETVWKSTSASGAPDNSSLSHFSAMTWPSWQGRAVRDRHRHAIEQASRRWRGGRRDDSANAP